VHAPAWALLRGRQERGALYVRQQTGYVPATRRVKPGWLPPLPPAARHTGSVTGSGAADGKAQIPAVGRALLILGDRWTLLILQRAFLGARRFSQWQDQLGVSNSVLTSRLRELERYGVLVRVPDPAYNGRCEYRLTDRGLDLWSVLVAIWAWEKRWILTRPAPLPELRHHRCGLACVPRLTCTCAPQPVTPRDTTALRRSNARISDVSPARLHRRTSAAPSLDPLSFLPGTMELLGNRWSTAVLTAGFLGIRRFRDFERDLGIPPVILADRLRRFVELGVFRRVVYDERYGREEYRFSAKGLAFFDVLALLVRWGERWLAGPAEPVLVIRHRRCGRVLEPVLRCDRCQAVLNRREVRFLL
jgi:DNA-binding HxlR family transcriptional regulator